MGIKGFGKFLYQQAPACIREQNIKSFLGQVIAIDASMSLYQFMIAIRDTDNFGTLVNDSGEPTSHISGFLARATRLLEHGIKPLYVFDGEPTKLKSGELAKRQDRRTKAEEQLENAVREGDTTKIKKYMGRTVHITRQHSEDVKELLKLMGLPIIQAPSEAEAQCAKLVKDKIAFATATEDTDALTFGSSNVIRHLNSSAQQNKDTPILLLNLENILKELDLSMNQFVDFCILCGCDYCDRLKKIGPQTAYKMIKKYKTIEDIIPQLDATQKSSLNDFNFLEARDFFINPKVLDSADIPKIVWNNPLENELREFLVGKHNFNPSRVDSFIQRIKLSQSQRSQTRLESFFSVRKMPDSQRTNLTKAKPAKPLKKAKSAAGKKSAANVM